MRFVYFSVVCLLVTVTFAGDNIVSVQTSGPGQVGSQNNIISVCLKNQSIVRSAQFKITDVPNYLSLQLNSEITTERTAGFTLATNEVDGVINIVLITIDSTQSIQPDSGAIFQFMCSVNPDATPDTLQISFTEAIITDNRWNQLDVIARNNTFVVQPGTKVNAAEKQTVHYYLAQNYPNPFNPRTMIEFSVVHSGDVQLDIYDILGKKVRSLVQNKLTSGIHHVFWEGLDDRGNSVASGVYFYKIVTGNFIDTKRLVLIR